MSRLEMKPLVELVSLSKHYQRRTFDLFGTKKPQTVKAVREVTLTIQAGETVGLVGESGAGKTTVGRLILRLETPTSGEIRFRGSPISRLSHRQFQPLRRHLQMVFQDSYASMNSRFTVADTLNDPLIRLTDLSQADRSVAVSRILEDVGLDERFLPSYRHQLSGGQAQRVNIARSLVINPDFVVLDEPVSALDASVRGWVLQLLRDLQHKYNLSYLYISHDLQTVRAICDLVAIMFLGAIVEIGRVESIFDSPAHPYTKGLLSSILVPDPVARRQRADLSSQQFQQHNDWMNDPLWGRRSGGEFLYPPLVEIAGSHYVARSYP